MLAPDHVEERVGPRTSRRAPAAGARAAAAGTWERRQGEGKAALAEQPMNLYELLGVTPQADEADIRSAFRKKTRATHPDKFNRWVEKQKREGRTFSEDERLQLHDDWVKKFEELRLAHDVLTDPYRRGVYDQTGQTSADKPKPIPITHAITMSQQMKGGDIPIEQEGFRGTVSIQPNARLPCVVQVEPSREFPRGATITLEAESAEAQTQRLGSNAVTFMRIDLGGADWERRVEQALDVRDALGTLLRVRRGEDDARSWTFLDRSFIATTDLQTEQSRRQSLGGKDSAGNYGGNDLLAVLEVTPEQALLGGFERMIDLPDGTQQLVQMRDGVSHRERKRYSAGGVCNSGTTDRGDLAVEFRIQPVQGGQVGRRKLGLEGTLRERFPAPFAKVDQQLSYAQDTIQVMQQALNQAETALQDSAKQRIETEKLLEQKRGELQYYEEQAERSQSLLKQWDKCWEDHIQTKGYWSGNYSMCVNPTKSPQQGAPRPAKNEKNAKATKKRGSKTESDLQEKCQKFERDLQRSNEDLEKLRQQLEDQKVQHDTQLASLQRSTGCGDKAAREELAEARARLGELQAELDGAHQETKQVRSELEQEAQSKNDLRKSLDELQTQFSIAKAERDRATQKTEQVRSELEQEIRSKKVLEESKNVLERSKNELEAQIRLAVEKLDEEKAELRWCMDMMESESPPVAPAKTEGISYLLDAVHSLAPAREVLSHTIRETVVAKSSITNTLRQKNAEFDEERQQHEKTRSQLQELQAKHEELQTKMGLAHQINQRTTMAIQSKAKESALAIKSAAAKANNAAHAYAISTDEIDKVLIAMGQSTLTRLLVPSEGEPPVGGQESAVDFSAATTTATGATIAHEFSASDDDEDPAPGTQPAPAAVLAPAPASAHAHPAAEDTKSVPATTTATGATIAQEFFDSDDDEDPAPGTQPAPAAVLAPAPASAHAHPAADDTTVSDKLKEVGNKAFKDGNFDRAIDCYTKAIEALPQKDHSKASTLHANRAACYKNLHDFKAVVIDCTAALDIDPNHHKARLRRGCVGLLL